MKVAIIGGGIGGLSAALFMQRAGVDVTVYEQAPEFSEVGAGIQVGPNAVKLLHRLGLKEQLARLAVAPHEAWQFRRWSDGQVLFSQPLARAEELFGAPYLVVHRADLLDGLVQLMPPDHLKLDHQLQEVQQDQEGVTLRFSNGETVRADVAIGADGIHSRVREAIVEATPPRFSDLVAYRGITPLVPGLLSDDVPRVTIWVGPGRHLVHYPIAGGTKLNYVAIAPAHGWNVESWNAEGSVQEALGEFAGWHPEVHRIIAATEISRKWALFDREPLSTWTRGRLTLLGDAAHPMLPFFAQGAGQAIEDAAALAKCVAAGDAVAAPALLQRYEEVRKPRAVGVQQKSRERGMEYHLPDGAEQQARDLDLANSDPLAANEWLYGFDAESFTV